MPDVEAITRLRRKVDEELPTPWEAWPGGWPGEIEVALIDAVFSIQANYTGARNVVARWREHRGDGSLDDLGELSRYRDNPQEFADICENRQMVPGQSSTKAEAIVIAATRLAGDDIGVVHADDLEVDNPHHRGAYVGVPGLGDQTWTYLGMLLGKPGVKADTMIRRFVAASQGSTDVDPSEAQALVEAVASDIGCSATDLDHAIWSHQRRL